MIIEALKILLSEDKIKTAIPKVYESTGKNADDSPLTIDRFYNPSWYSSAPKEKPSNNRYPA